MGTTKPFTYEVDPNFDHVLEEKGNTYTALRKIRWGDREDFKVDVRKYYATEEGERMSKGCSFMSDEGVNEMVNVLIDNDYGNAKRIADSIVEKRMDICARVYDHLENDQSLKKDLDKMISEGFIEDDESEEYYDLEGVI